MKSKADALVKLLKEKKLTLALVESVTCGMAAEKLSSSKGVSDVLAASLVCYTPEAKIQLLGVRRKTIKQFSCESPEVTKALARNLCKLIKADVYAAVTGLASPGGSETKDKPVGTVFYCAYIHGKKYKLKKKFNGSPREIKEKACKALYEFIQSNIR